ncbi:hypothetical protein [Paenibacillus alvei]|nr:hypothetical protein [Paenibacillus alvei]
MEYQENEWIAAEDTVQRTKVFSLGSVTQCMLRSFTDKINHKCRHEQFM